MEAQCSKDRLRHNTVLLADDLPLLAEKEYDLWGRHYETKLSCKEI
jgi:hypothetical protein